MKPGCREIRAIAGAKQTPQPREREDDIRAALAAILRLSYKVLTSPPGGAPLISTWPLSSMVAS